MIYENLIKPIMFIPKLTVIILLCTSSCNFFLREKVSPVETLSYEIDRELSKIAKTKYNLNILGNGGSIDNDKVATIAIYLSNEEVITISEARNLIVHLTNDFVQKINNTTEYYNGIENPLNLMEQIKISISISEKGDIFHNKGLAIVHNNRGTIYYCIRNPEKPTSFHTFPIHKETFEEAEQILAQENKNVISP